MEPARSSEARCHTSDRTGQDRTYKLTNSLQRNKKSADGGKFGSKFGLFICMMWTVVNAVGSQPSNFLLLMHVLNAFPRRKA